MKRRTEEESIIKSLTKFWFHSSKKLIGMGVGDFFYGITMALEDIAEWITYRASLLFERMEWSTQCIRGSLYWTWTGLQHSYRWVTYREGSNPFLLNKKGTNRKWREAWFGLRAAGLSAKETVRLIVPTLLDLVKGEYNE